MQATLPPDLIYPLSRQFPYLDDSTLYFSLLVQDIKLYCLKPYLESLHCREICGEKWSIPCLTAQLQLDFPDDPEAAEITNQGQLLVLADGYLTLFCLRTGHRQSLCPDKTPISSNVMYHDISTGTFYLAKYYPLYGHIDTLYALWLHDNEWELEVVETKIQGEEPDYCEIFQMADPLERRCFFPYQFRIDYDVLNLYFRDRIESQVRLALVPSETQLPFVALTLTYYGGFIFVISTSSGQETIRLDLYQVKVQR